MALDDQQVVARERRRGDVDVGEDARAGDSAPEWVEQTPGHLVLVAVQAQPVQVDPVAGLQRQRVQRHLGHRTENAGDHGTGRDRRRLGDVKQAELERSGGFGVAVDHQVVAARIQRQVGLVVGSVGLVDVAAADHRAARSGERPQQVAVVAQRVEEHALLRVERERVVAGLPGAVDRRVDAAAQRQRRGLVADRAHIEGERTGAAGTAHAFDHHQVTAAHRQHGQVAVVAAVVDVLQHPPQRIDDAPVRHRASRSEHVEIHPLAGARVEAVQLRAGRRIHLRDHARVQADSLRRAGGGSVE